MNIRKTYVDNKLNDILGRAIDKNNLDYFFGTWKIDYENYSVKEFIIKKENIITTINSNDKHSVCSKCSNIHNGNIKYVVGVPLSCIKFKNHIRPYYTYPDKSYYRLILHENGVIKFVPQNDSVLNRLILARNDSKSLLDWIKNLHHFKHNGCFCLGILTKYNTIERYNRWNDKNIDKYWTAYRIN